MAITQVLDQAHRGRRVERAVPTVAVCIVAITSLHYLTGAHFLPYHSIYRSLYYLPIAVAAITWGLRGGLVASLTVSALYLPHIVLLGEVMPGGILDNLLEVLLFNFVGALAGWLADAQRREQQQSSALRTYIDAVLASLPVGVATIDGDGQLMARNPAGAALLAKLDRPTWTPPPTGYAEQVLADRPVGVHCSPIQDATGTAPGKVIVLEDLSEQRRLHEQVRQAEQLASLGQLAGGLAHEVRNPLGILRATAQLLASRLAGDEAVRTYTTVLRDEADRIDRLVGQLLAYANPRPPQLAPCDPAALVAELAHAFEPYAVQQGVRLSSVTDASLPRLNVDGEQIRQALLNLLLNAVQASPPRGHPGAQVELRCYRTPAHICVAVRDHGPGIPDELRGRVFDPFFTTRDDGTGMGLPMVARIAADHGGTIDLQHAPGGGTLATLCLPAEIASSVVEGTWLSAS